MKRTSMNSVQQIEAPMQYISATQLRKTRCMLHALRASTTTRSSFLWVTLRLRDKGTSPRVALIDVDDMNNADVTIGDIIENQIKLDTRLSYFQSNIFTHTQGSFSVTSYGEPQKQPHMEQSDQARRYAPGRRHPG
jgi:hypothetical protein